MNSENKGHGALASFWRMCVASYLLPGNASSVPIGETTRYIAQVSFWEQQTSKESNVNPKPKLGMKSPISCVTK
jgi:hypothetical protein